MATIDLRCPSLILCIVWMASFFSASVSQPSTETQYDAGVVSQYCSEILWPNSTQENVLVLNQDIPMPIEVVLLDQLCEDPSCVDAGVDCLIGNCSSCVPITEDYSNTTFVSFRVHFNHDNTSPRFTSNYPVGAFDQPSVMAEKGFLVFSAGYANGSGSEPYLGIVNCTVRPQLTNNPGHYNGSCTCANQLMDEGDVYLLYLIVMDHDNSTVLAQVPQYVQFGAGNPSVPNFWAEFEQPPLAIYHKNMLRVWMKDFMNNTIAQDNRNIFDQPVSLDLVITTKAGAPANMIIPPVFDVDFLRGYYFAPVAPSSTGDYVATIKAGNVHIANSPLPFTVGKKFGVPTRQPSSSTPILLESWLSSLLMVSSAAGTLTCLLKNF